MSVMRSDTTNIGQPVPAPSGQTPKRRQRRTTNTTKMRELSTLARRAERLRTQLDKTTSAIRGLKTELENYLGTIPTEID